MSAYTYNITLIDNTILKFSKINERLIILNPIHSDFENKDEKGNIIELNYNNNYKVQLDKVITLKEKYKYKISSIIRDDRGFAGPGYYLYTHKKITKSTVFIMPFLGGIKSNYRYDNEFINCFIGTEEEGDYGCSIYLLYRYSGNLDFAKFESSLIQHELFEEVIEVDKCQSLYRFKIPEDKKEDINKLIDGKYSTISNDSKERLLKFNNAIKNGPLEQILYKSEDRRLLLEREYECNIPIDNELHSKFIVEEELFMNYYIIE